MIEVLGDGNYPLDVGSLSAPSSHLAGSESPFYLRGEPFFAKVKDDGSMIPPDAIREVTVFLYRGSGFSSDPLGSGFYTCVEEEGKVFPYLVTCKHVVHDGFDKSGTLQIRLNRSDAMEVGTADLPKTGWIYHDDPGIDLAIQLHIAPPNPKPLRLVVPTWESLFDEGMLAQTPQPLDDVLFVGLLPKAPGVLRNNPVFRSGKVVAPIEEKIRGGGFGPAFVHMVECHFNRGNSGAPLWQGGFDMMQQKHNYWLIGVICAGLVDAGIAFAHPVHRLNEILKGDKAVKQRQAMLKQAASADTIALSTREDDRGFTRADLESALKKVARRKKAKPSPPDGASRRT